MSINLSPKLLETIKEINDAVNSLTVAKGVRKNPRDIINVGKIIEKGEKKIQKEFAKRTEELENIQKEMELINEFATSMGYTLTETPETPETPETTETTETPESTGIKITVGTSDATN